MNIMNKFLFVLLVIIGINTTTNAQNSKKVKGNRDVTIKQTLIDPFNTIKVGGNFKIDIIFNTEPSIEIETDDNLHEYIGFKVIDSVLTFTLTSKITSKKKLNIIVNYDKSLQHIETIETGEIRSLATMDLSNASLKIQGNSRAELTIKTDSIHITNMDRAKIKLNLTTTNTFLELGGNSKLEALIYSSLITTNLDQRAIANIEGDSDDFSISTDNYSKFNGKNFTTKTCNILSEIGSEVTLEVTDSIIIDASGSSKIYLYNNPKIVINNFTDTVRLQKRTK